MTPLLKKKREGKEFSSFILKDTTLPTVLDKLVMVGNINVRKLVSEVSDQIKIRGTRIADLSERIKLLEKNYFRLLQNS